MSDLAKTAKAIACPFCGRKASICKGKKRAKTGEWIWKPSAGCRHCKFHREFDATDAMLNWWNTRKKWWQSDE